MALNAAVVWEVRTTGSDNNGGGFKAGASGTDYSQQDAAQATLTTASVVHTTTTQINVDAGDYTVVADDVGNIVQVTGGTATAGFYEITAVDTGNNRWTVDRSVGTAGQTVAGAMGGAVASLGKIGGVWVAGNIIYVKAGGTFSVTSASTNVSSGCINSSALVSIIGYNTNRNTTNTDTKPTIVVNVASATVVTGSGALLINLSIDGNNQTSSKLSAGATFLRCYLTGFNTASTALSPCLFCEITANSASVCTTALVGSYVYSNTAAMSVLTAIGNVVINNSGASTDGLSMGSTALARGNSCYGNGRDGIASIGGGSGVIISNICEANGRYGIRTENGIKVVTNNATYNNTSGSISATSTAHYVYGNLSLSSSAFTNAGSGDFSLNNTAGGGADVRAVASPSTLGSTSNYEDLGAAQHADPAGGGLAANPIRGFIS